MAIMARTEVLYLSAMRDRESPFHYLVLLLACLVLLASDGIFGLGGRHRYGRRANLVPEMEHCMSDSATRYRIGGSMVDDPRSPTQHVALILSMENMDNNGQWGQTRYCDHV